MRRFPVGQVGWCSSALLGMVLSGCNSFDEPAPDASVPRLVIPVDERAAAASPVRPATISGGTLLVTADGRFAIAADPERDRVSILDLASTSVIGAVTLQPGDEPGRSVEDGQGRVHVALRRGGALATIDPATATLVDRRQVCKSPRGVAFDVATELLHVACAEGKLVSLPASGGAITRTVTLQPDLRDVMVRGSELWVTRFKSAEVLRIASTGALNARVRFPDTAGTLERPVPLDNPTEFSSTSQPVLLGAGVAWRAAPTAAGGAIVVHQQAVLDPIEITAPSAQGSAYGGGGFGCGGIVKDAVTSVAPDGTVTTTTVAGSPLPVDVAVSPDQQWLVVAHAGPADTMAPRPTVVFPSEGAGPLSNGGVAFGPTSTLSVLPMGLPGSVGDCQFGQGSSVAEPLSAVAFTPGGRLIAQAIEPPQLLIIDALPWGNVLTIPLPGESRLDTGHEIFHRDAGGGIACASCHPEGGEDGHTWQFTDTGARRTQPLHVGLRDTAPFHWNGDLPSVGELMSAVFVGRMGGVRQTPERLARLSEWLFTLPAPPAIRESSDEAAARGRTLFESPSVGCATCHSGAKLTDNLSVAIDTVNPARLQVPSLVAVGYRAPFMHTGCAATLAARFDPACGGDSHGNTSTLTPAQIDDLVAYLETL